MGRMQQVKFGSAAVKRVEDSYIEQMGEGEGLVWSSSAAGLGPRTHESLAQSCSGSPQNRNHRACQVAP